MEADFGKIEDLSRKSAPNKFLSYPWGPFSQAGIDSPPKPSEEIGFWHSRDLTRRKLADDGLNRPYPVLGPGAITRGPGVKALFLRQKGPETLPKRPERDPQSPPPCTGRTA